MSSRCRLLFAGAAAVLCSRLLVAAPTYTGSILLNTYDVLNVTLADQHGGTGWFAGRHMTTHPYQGGTTNAWLPSGTTQDILYSMVFPSALTLDSFNLVIPASNNGVPVDIFGAGSRIEYTPEGLTWNTLVNGIQEGAGVQTFSAPGSFTATTVRGLRWVLPAANHNEGGGWAPALLYLHAYGTNTVPVDPRLNLVAAGKATISQVQPWSNANSLPALANQELSGRALWQSGAVPANAYLQLALDQKYALSFLALNWEGGPHNDYAATRYDVAWSEDGVTWFPVADNNPTDADRPSDRFFFPSYLHPLYVRISDFGANGSGHEILREIALYGAPVPEPAAGLLLVVLGGALLGARRRTA